MDFLDSSPEPEERVIRSHNLTEEQVKDLETAFSVFDTEGIQVIPIEQLRPLMHSVAQEPSKVEMQDIFNEIDPDRSGELYFSDFLYVMSQRYANMSPEDEIIAAFRVFDKEGTGLINETEFRYIMMNLGEKMSEEEVEEIIRDADADHEGNIDYVRFVNMMSET
ncbi:hypothetical protein KR009_005164 [Drosophila setifemur]|nr:hypothetical protein KR009_005164 [Drosophila setifemur]